MNTYDFVGAQPMVTGTVYQMGLQCPIGQEISLVLNLDKIFPDIHKNEAKEFLLKGLADRFGTPQRRQWDGR